MMGTILKHVFLNVKIVNKSSAQIPDVMVGGPWRLMSPVSVVLALGQLTFAAN